MADGQIFYVYVDWTTEEVPRAFYVGKGVKRRIKDTKRRSVVWNRIRNKYGLNRIVVLATEDESYAFEIEIGLIRQHKTFMPAWYDGSGWGANLTTGGDGVSGREGPLNHFYGKHHSNETKKIIGDAHRGSNNCWYGITGPDHPSYGSDGYWFGKHRSNETKRKLSEANTGEKNPGYGKPSPRKGSKSSPETIQKLMESVSRGENNHLSKLTDEKVLRILQMLKDGIDTKTIAKDFNTSRSNIYEIKYNHTWKHITR